jgi:cytochrome d ubiquinol oxidase subunit I
LELSDYGWSRVAYDFISLIALVIDFKNLYIKFSWFLVLLTFAIALPYLANTTGWILTEVGRYPWVVYELLKQQDGVSQVVSSGMFLTSLIGFILIYGLIIIATVYLMMKFAKAGPDVIEEEPAEFTPSLVNPPESK